MGETADNVTGGASQRLRQLLQMLERQPNDPFLLYGVAMEHKKVGHAAHALEYFDQVLRHDPNYCYAYYQRAQVEESNGDEAAARRTLREGLDAAARCGDEHARQEIEAALALLG